MLVAHLVVGAANAEDVDALDALVRGRTRQVFGGSEAMEAVTALMESVRGK